jgi:hypothetical protein
VRKTFYNSCQFHIQVEILDVNDHSPTIAGGAPCVLGVSVYESSESGVALASGDARDDDLARNGIERFELSSQHPGESMFRLVVRQRADDVSIDLYLELTRRLDREVDGDCQVNYSIRCRVYAGFLSLLFGLSYVP